MSEDTKIHEHAWILNGLFWLKISLLNTFCSIGINKIWCRVTIIATYLYQFRSIFLFAITFTTGILIWCEGLNKCVNGKLSTLKEKCAVMYTWQTMLKKLITVSQQRSSALRVNVVSQEDLSSWLKLPRVTRTKNNRSL